MRLLFSAAFDTRANVGISLYIRRIAPELARLCELTVLTPDPELFANAARVIRIPEYTRSHPGRVFWTAAMLGRYCTRDFDAVLCPTPVVPIDAPLPTVAVVHDLTPLMLPRLHSTKLKALFWLALQSLRWADAVITDSTSTRNDLVACTELIPLERIAVAYAGPSMMLVNPDPSFAADLVPYILYVGGHALHKNLHRLLAAFARLHCPPSVRLVITGWGKPELVARTRSAVRRYGLEPRVVILTDRLTDAQLSSLYGGCAVFAYPSLYEGFGLPVLEAMAHGAPVACSRTSSLPEVGGDAVLYFDPLSADDIATKMGAILTDRKLESELRMHGRARAREFSWESTARGIYETTLAAMNSKHTRRRR
jgi:glycosyltransferase involved in cell wall biosynthesis